MWWRATLFGIAAVLLASRAAQASNTSNTTAGATPWSATAASVVIVGNFGPEDANQRDLLRGAPYPPGTALPDMSSWFEIFNQTLPVITEKIVGATPGAQINEPAVVNTQGSLELGLQGMTQAFDSAQRVDVVIIADELDLSVALQRAVMDRFGTAVLILMAFAAATDPTFVSTSVAPSTIRIVPSDDKAAHAAVASLRAFGWEAISTVSAGDEYGTGLVASLEAAMNSGANPPRILSREVLSSPHSASRDTEDEAIVTRLAKTGARGVVVLAGRGAAVRLLNAVRRVASSEPAVNNLFFLFFSEAVFDVPSGLDLVNAAFLLPNIDLHLRPTGLGVVMLNVAECIVVLAKTTAALSQANSVISGPVLFSAIQGHTLPSTTEHGVGPISFDAQDRVECDFIVVRPTSDARTPKLIAKATCSGETAVIDSGLDPADIPPRSERSAVEVCLVGSESCADYANVNHALLALLDANAATHIDPAAPTLPAGISIVPVALAAGSTGAKAIEALLEHSKTCDVLIGPSRTSLTVAINPLTTFYGIPTVDYGSTSPGLSDKFEYPYFSRTVPSATNTAVATAALFKHLKWSRAAIVTTRDTAGAATIATYEEAFLPLNIELEDSYPVGPHRGTAEALLASFRDIKERLITRVVILAVTWSDEQMAVLFSVIQQLEMTESHLFILSDTVCQYSAINPAARLPLIGSFCVEPQYDAVAYGTVLERLLQADNTAATAILSRGGFDTSRCDPKHQDIYSPFAHDAAWAVISAIEARITANNGSMANVEDPSTTVFADGTAVVDAVRSVQFPGYTGEVAFNPAGDRANASFNVRIQQRRGVVTFGSWSEAIGFVPNDNENILWADNSTKVPADTTRGVTFIAEKEAEDHPALIVISILGFLVTIAAFVFCFKYQVLKKKQEEFERQQHKARMRGDDEMNMVGGGTRAPPPPAASITVDYGDSATPEVAAPKADV